MLTCPGMALSDWEAASQHLQTGYTGACSTHGHIATCYV